MYSRRFDRTKVEKETDCIVNGERNYVLLYDLSCGGCMIETSPRRLVIGDKIDINLGNAENAKGKVVWATDHNAGVKFTHDIAEIVVQYLGFDPSRLPFVDMTPRDRFGSPLIFGRKFKSPTT